MALDKNQELINALQLENHQIDHSFLMIRTPEGEYYNYWKFTVGFMLIFAENDNKLEKIQIPIYQNAKIEIEN